MRAVAWFLITLGAVVAAAWLTGSRWPETLVPGLFQLKINTAVLFLVTGVGLMAATVGSRRVAVAAGGVLFAAAGASLLQYAVGDLGIDQLLLRDIHYLDDAHPGRMSPGTAVAFVMAAISLLLFEPGRSPVWREAAMEVASFLVFAAGVAGLAGHAIGAASAFTWRSEAVMSTPTAAGFVVAGIGLLWLVWGARGAAVADAPVWMPAALCSLVLALDVAVPLGVAVPIGYIPLVISSVWLHRLHATFVFAAVGTVLTVAGALASPSADTVIWMAWMNRLLIVAAIWLTAMLVHARRQVGNRVRVLARIVESAHDAIVSEAVDGAILSWNAAAEKLFGYSAAEAVGRNLDDLIPVSHHGGNDGSGLMLQREDPRSGEVVCLRKDGQPVEVAVTVSKVVERDGHVVGVSRVFRDLSDLKRADMRFRTVLESAPTALVAVDSTGCIVLVNSQAVTLFGYERGEMLGQKIEMLVPKRFSDSHPGHRAKFFTDPQARPMGAGRDLYGQRKDGSEFPIEIGLSPMTTDMGQFVLSTVVDISDRMLHEKALRSANEALEQSNIELQRYLYIASHDLQTPMRSIGSFVGLLQETYGDQLDAQANDWMRRARQSIGHLQTLTRDLLEYSRIETESRPFESVSMRDVFDDAVQLLDAVASECGADVSRGELPTVRGDRPQLVQLMQNLVGNALKYRASDETPRIRFTAELIDDEWVFALSDNGIGIAPKHQTRIFEMFRRLHDQSEYSGTGIGLAVCRRVVRRHGGRIWVESDSGRGSVFYFTLPRETNT